MQSLTCAATAIAPTPCPPPARAAATALARRAAAAAAAAVVSASLLLGPGPALSDEGGGPIIIRLPASEDPEILMAQVGGGLARAARARACKRVQLCSRESE